MHNGSTKPRSLSALQSIHRSQLSIVAYGYNSVPAVQCASGTVCHTPVINWTAQWKHDAQKLSCTPENCHRSQSWPCRIEVVQNLLDLEINVFWNLLLTWCYVQAGMNRSSRVYHLVLLSVSVKWFPVQLFLKSPHPALANAFQSFHHDGALWNCTAQLNTLPECTCCLVQGAAVIQAAMFDKFQLLFTWRCSFFDRVLLTSTYSSSCCVWLQRRVIGTAEFQGRK